jgi:hypothetical protein
MSIIKDKSVPKSKKSKKSASEEWPDIPEGDYSKEDYNFDIPEDEEGDSYRPDTSSDYSQGLYDKYHKH